MYEGSHGYGLRCGATARSLGLAVLVLLVSSVAPARAESKRSGRELYDENCASCHGADGRGHIAREADFPVTPPDFTDCNFTTREADLDWLASIHYGGPARGFSRLMPAFVRVLSDGEMEQIVKYMREFCTEPGWPRGELNLPRAFVTEKAFPEDEAVISVTAGKDDVTTELSYERRFGRRSQIEVLAPIVFSQQDSGDWAGGIGDIELAVKHVIVATTNTIVSPGLAVITPTGRVDRGFGGGTAMFEGFLTYGQRLPANLFLQIHAGGAVAYDRDYPDELFARAAFGDQIIPVRYGRMWSPMVEVTSRRELSDGASVEVDVIPQMQVTVSARQHIRASAGASIPVTEREGRSTQFLAYLLWDWADGGLLEGW